MNTSLLHSPLGSRKAWYSGLACLLLAISAVALWRPLLERYFPEARPTVPIEDVLWTATPDYKIFFGPGTAPSAELAATIRSLKDGYGLSEDILRFPNTPIFVSPRLFMAEGSTNDIVLYTPFTQAAAGAIRSEYREERQKNKR